MFLRACLIVDAQDHIVLVLFRSDHHENLDKFVQTFGPRSSRATLGVVGHA